MKVCPLLVCTSRALMNACSCMNPAVQVQGIPVGPCAFVLDPVLGGFLLCVSVQTLSWPLGELGTRGRHQLYSVRFVSVTSAHWH